MNTLALSSGTLHNDTRTECAPADKNALAIPMTPSALTCPLAESQELKTTKAGDMLSVSISLGKINMCSFSAKPDLDIGNEEVKARNPPDADPCVAK